MPLFTVRPGDTGWAINYPSQRKVFVAHERIWIFYAGCGILGRNTCYRSGSISGARWNREQVLERDVGCGHRFGVWLDGVNKFHYVFSRAGLGDGVFHNSGRADGDSIVWKHESVKVYDTPSHLNAYYPNVVVSGEDVWVSFLEMKYVVPNSPPYWAKVLRITGTGTEEFLLAHKTTEGYPIPVGVPVNNFGSIIWTYNIYRNGENVYASRIYHPNSGFASEEIRIAGGAYAHFAAASGDRFAHFVFANTPAGMYYQNMELLSETWSPLVLFSSARPALVTVSQDNDLAHAYWVDEKELTLLRATPNLTSTATVIGEDVYEACYPTQTRPGNHIPRKNTYICDYGDEEPLCPMAQCRADPTHLGRNGSGGPNTYTKQSEWTSATPQPHILRRDRFTIRPMNINFNVDVANSFIAFTIGPFGRGRKGRPLGRLFSCCKIGVIQTTVDNTLVSNNTADGGCVAVFVVVSIAAVISLLCLHLVRSAAVYRRRPRLIRVASVALLGTCAHLYLF